MALIDKLNAIGDAIRLKNGGSDLIPLADMPQAILNIAGGGGSGDSIEYSAIVYNDDDTITLTDTDGNEHTIVCEYDGGKLVGATYDGKAIELTYNDDSLVGIGGTDVDLSNAKVSGGTLLDHTVTFYVGGEPYEVMSVKDGNSVNAPINSPMSENGTFIGWMIGSDNVVFPLIPTSDTDINAKFQVVRTEIEIKTEGALVCSHLGSKVNSETAIYGYYKASNIFVPILIGRTSEAVQTTVTRSFSEVEYNGETWYFQYSNPSDESTIKDGVVQPYYLGSSSYSDRKNMAAKLLDYYFMKI